MSAGSPQIAVAGVGSTAITRKAGVSIGEVAIAAALDAIADAGLTKDDIDGYVGCPSAPNVSATHEDGVDEVSHAFMTEALGIECPRWSMDVTGMSTGMVLAAADALAAGRCDYVLAMRALSPGRAAKYSFSEAATFGGAEQFTMPYGLGPAGGRFAIWLNRYIHDSGATRRDLFEIALLARENARRNPLAIWRDGPALDWDAYAKSRFICEPLCLFDCDMPVTGAAALVITTAARAEKLRHAPAYIAAFSHAGDPGALFRDAGIAPGAVQVAQIYDGYAALVWLWLEKFGFCEQGRAFEFMRGERIRRGGRLPLNTFGGALGEGRLHGVGHVREAVLQAMGRAGERQVEHVRHSLAQVGIPERSWSILFSSEPVRA